jgi:hypothetical protein
MAIYSVIDTADSGDTRYEGFVKAAANFAILEGYQSITTVASHATTAPIWAAAGTFINYTGTATATDFPDAGQAGMMKILICAGASVFTHAGNITVQGDATFTAEAGDWVIVTAITTGTFKLNIVKKNGLPVNQGVATQTQVEAITSNVTVMTPLNTNWHPGVAKCWLNAAGAGTSISASHNITSITDTGTGVLDVTIGTDFSSANYVIISDVYSSGNDSSAVELQTRPQQTGRLPILIRIILPVSAIRHKGDL